MTTLTTFATTRGMAYQAGNGSIVTLIRIAIALTVIIANVSSGAEKRPATKAMIALVRDRQGVEEYALQAESPVGKRLVKWLSSLSAIDFHGDMLNNYAPSRVVYYVDGTKVNVLDNGQIVMTKKGILGRQMSIKLDAKDPILTEYRAIFDELQRGGEGITKKPPEK